MLRQAGIVDPADAWIVLQEFGHLESIAAVALHAHVQGFRALQNLPGAHRRQGRTVDPQGFHAGAHGKAKIAKGLVKPDAVVALGGFRHARKLAVVPRKLAALNQYPGQRRAVTTEVLGG